MVSGFIFGIILGFFSCMGSIIIAVNVTAMIAEKKRREPRSKEDWRVH